MINGISFLFSANLKESDRFRIVNKDIISIISEDIIDHLISLISLLGFFFVNQLKKYLNFGLIKQNRFDLDSWKIHYN